ncbi:MAG: hypothetical protein HC914_04130 [Chloroflexaceae bacterium]|nr:hypothetical protein [Chloroflexaceae bacterium]
MVRWQPITATQAQSLALTSTASATQTATPPPITPTPTTTAVTSPTPSVDPDLLGLVIRDPWYDFGTAPGQPSAPNYAAQDRMGQMLAVLGVQWVRFEFQIEGTTEAEVIAQIARNDYFIREVAPRHNLKIVALLGTNLVRGRDLNDLVVGATYTDPLYGGGVNDYMKLWLDRARLIADRYKGDVDVYEVLNEHNRAFPDGRGISADIAARLHTKFYRFFRQVDRAAPGDQTWRDDVLIIGGGLHPAGSGQIGSSRYVSDREYVRQLYASDGFRSYRQTYGRFPIDGMGYHPYPEEIRISPQSELDLITTRLDRVREVLEEVGDPDLPFWVTELGYNIAFGRQTEQGQAAFLRQSLETMAARDDVATFFWFKYEDFPPATGPNAQQWGVLRIPFTEANCPGGACYEPRGRPDLLRESFWVFREFAGRTSTPPEPPARLVIEGTDTRYLTGATTITLTARVSRASATLPLTYRWEVNGQPVLTDVTTGTLTSTLVLTRTAPATLDIFVEVGNSGGVVIVEDRLVLQQLQSRVFLPLLRRP